MALGVQYYSRDPRCLPTPKLERNQAHKLLKASQKSALKLIPSVQLSTAQKQSKKYPRKISEQLNEASNFSLFLPHFFVF